LLLNPDSLVAPEFLQHLVETANSKTMAGPKVLSSTTGRLATYAGPFDWFRGRSLDTHWDEPAEAAFLHYQEVEEAGFVCMLIPAAAFRVIGNFDERFGMYCEDTDFCIRARKAGYRIVIEPQAVIRHLGQASSGNNGNEFFYYYATRNRLHILWTHGGTLRRFVYIGGYLAFFLSGLARLMLERRWRMCRVWLTALRDGLSGRIGMTYGPEDFAEPMPLIRRRQGTV
jgi:GT2 family glycosyltransferase